MTQLFIIYYQPWMSFLLGWSRDSFQNQSRVCENASALVTAKWFRLVLRMCFWRSLNPAILRTSSTFSSGAWSTITLVRVGYKPGYRWNLLTSVLFKSVFCRRIEAVIPFIEDIDNLSNCEVAQISLEESFLAIA